VDELALRVRDFHWTEDFDTVMDFLRDICVQTKSVRNWIPSRFENRRYGPCGPEYKDEEDGLVKIWEEIDEQNGIRPPTIVAISVFTDRPDSFISIHPDYTHYVLEIVLDIEKRKAGMPPCDDKGVRIAFWVEEDDYERISLLEELGYEDLGAYEHNRIRPLDMAIPDYQLPDGYSIRHVCLPEDYVRYRDVVGSVFSHCGEYMTRRAAVKYSEASFWHEGLDLVAVAPDGSFAAFTTVRLDMVSGIAEFEPVGTHPDHRKHGLARAVILESLKRLQEYNPTMICIPGAATNEGATRLYDSLGFTRVDVHAWRKFL
jgi:GNAT superfamily N-acetyltransferase